MSGRHRSIQGVLASLAGLSLDISDGQLTDGHTATHAPAQPIRLATSHRPEAGVRRQSRKGVVIYIDAKVNVLVAKEQGVVLASNLGHPT